LQQRLKLAKGVQRSQIFAEPRSCINRGLCAMADLVGSTMMLANLLLAVVNAARTVQSFKQQSKRFAERVNMLKDTLLTKASSPSAEALVRDLLLRIADFLAKLQTKKPLLKLMYHREITAQFAEFGASLAELQGDLDFCYNAPVYAAENLLDARDDFEQAQITNKSMMPEAVAEQTNKQLQLEAPPELRGFLEIDFDLLQRGQHLGEGSFGVVFKSSWSGMAVAVKGANTRAIDAATIKQLRKELRVHAMPEIKHERIIALYGG
jgi:Protein tyrosine and serine/threonine kinase